MYDFSFDGAATSHVLSQCGIGEAVVTRRTVPPVFTVKGTGLSFAGRTRGVAGVLMGADQTQRVDVAQIVAVDPGVPPRRGPVRC